MIKKTGTGLLAAIMFTLPAQAQTQDKMVTPQQIELYSEMWAMAGVCNQLANFAVAQADLADQLNADLADVDSDGFAAISAQRESKLEAIRAHVGMVREMPRGAGRQRAVDENAEQLMTRCRRLANHSYAGAYFRHTG